MIRKIKGTGGGGTGVTHGADGARRKGGRGGLKKGVGRTKGGKEKKNCKTCFYLKKKNALNVLLKKTLFFVLILLGLL